MLRILALALFGLGGCNPIVSLDSYCFGEPACASEDAGGAGGGSAGGAGGAGAVGYRDVIMADLPSAYFRFDEPAGSTTVTAEDGVLDGATESSDVTFGVPGALDGDSSTGAELNSDGHLVLDAAVFDVDGNSQFTIELWLKVAPGTSFLHAFDASENGGGHLIKIASEVTYFRFSGAENPTRQAGFAPDDDLWQYVAISYNGSVATFVVNDQVTPLDFQDPVGPYTAPVKIRSAFGEDPASVDELAIYPVALDSGTLLAHYGCGRDRTSCTVTGP